MNRFKLLPGALLVAGLCATSAWAQPAAPATRAEVKADTAAAQRDGTIPQGEAGVTKDRPKGGAMTTKMGAPTPAASR